MGRAGLTGGCDVGLDFRGMGRRGYRGGYRCSGGVERGARCRRAMGGSAVPGESGLMRGGVGVVAGYGCVELVRRGARGRGRFT